MTNISDEEFFNHFVRLYGTRSQAGASFDTHIGTTLQEEDAPHEGDAILDTTQEEVAVAI